MPPVMLFFLELLLLAVSAIFVICGISVGRDAVSARAFYVGAGVFCIIALLLVAFAPEAG